MNFNDIKDAVTGNNTIIQDAFSEILNMLIGFIPRLLAAILIIWIGFKLIKLLKRSLIHILERRNAERSIQSFLSSLIDALLRILFIIMAMDVIGIKATSFIAILGALGLAVGMALQGTLQNFAGGVIILLLRHFKVGDYIECGQYKGYVREIKIFNTTIQPFNARTIIVPNSELSNKSLINHTKEPIIRLDIKVVVAVSDLADSAVELSLWMWVKTDEYWNLWMHIREDIYKALYANDISIPFPQLDVHLDTQNPQSPASR